jgi:nucleoside-diphosphate-sugar epimerase
MILGIDGYLGWALSLRLAARGHEVSGMDNMATRKSVKEVGSTSATPIGTMDKRIKAAKEVHGFDIGFVKGDITNYGLLERELERQKPDAVIHFAEQRSAPYSMIDVNHAGYTMRNNIVGTINLVYAMRKMIPKAHMVKMGTLGEFGTPNFDVPEDAFVTTRIGGKEDSITVPKWAGSWYHWTKVHDTNNILFANRLWGLTSTDIMQGPVYGTRTKEITDKRLFTRFDFDEVWGTVINRYCVEAVLGMPLTPYGKGGQTRGFLSLEDSVEALRLLVENPPGEGKFRTVNQFRELHSVMELANHVKEAAKAVGMDVEIKPVENPRVEKESHYYNIDRKVLPDLGFDKLERNMKEELKAMLLDLKPYRRRLEKFRDRILPRTMWR